MAHETIAKLLIAAGVITLVGCAPMDKSSVRAKAGAPESAKVDEVQIAFDSELPRFVIAVEPVRFATSEMERRWVTQEDEKTKWNNSIKGENRTTSGRSLDARGQVDVGLHGGRRELGRSASEEPRTLTMPKSGGQGGIVPVDDGERIEKTEQGRNSSGEAKIEEGFAQGRGVGSASVTDRTTVVGTNKKSDTVTSAKSKTTQTDFTEHYYKDDPRARTIAAQLVSSLSGVGNFSLRDMRSVQSLGGARYRAELRDGEVGPFIMKALVTEYEAEVETDSTSANYFPVSRTKEKLRKGVVALDVTILDGRSGEIVASFPVQGTFASQDSKLAAGLVVPLYEERHFAQSVIDQATRVALNSAAERAFSVLSERVTQ